MGKTRVMTLLLAVIATAFAADASRTRPVMASGGHDGKGDDDTIVIRDDCDSDDPGWAPTGGCLRDHGDVDLAEFNGELTSPLSLSVIGHQAWRNDPSYLKIETDDQVRVRNKGGRTHTFTEVAAFGGGRVPPLNQGLTPAPECATAVNVAPGASVKLKDLSAGNHRYQCCIHPWMRAVIKVKEDH